MGDIHHRLLEVRQSEGLSQVAWRERLLRDGYEVSLTSVRNYEGARGAVPMPPADYVAQVALVFGLDLKWLLYGEAPQGSRFDRDRRAYFILQRVRSLLEPE